MALLTDCFAEAAEIQRLNELLPVEMRSQVAIVRSLELNPSLITTERTQKHQFTIQLDCIRWQALNPNQQDLLFWHEVARIQSRTVPRLGWELPVMGISLGVTLLEISSHNVISLAAALVAIALSGHQLHQRNRGERSLREAAAADSKAIQLAVASGYTFSEALTSLYSALKVLTKSAQRSKWQRYQVRLRALEILAMRQEKHCYSGQLEVSWQS